VRLGGRFGGIRFAWARARAAVPPLVALAVTAAVAAALVVGLVAALRAVEAQDVRAVLAATTGDRGVARVSGDDVAALETAVRSVLAGHGVDAVVVTTEDGRVVITPDATRFTGGEVTALTAALDAIPDAVEGRVQVTGGLSITLDDIEEGLQTRRGPAVVAIGFVGLLAVVVVGAVALEPVRVRAGESQLLRARGARRRTLSVGAAVEALSVAILGAAVGAAVVVLLAPVLTLPSPGILFAGVIALAVALTATLVAAIVTARGVDAPRTRAQVAVFAGAAVILAVLTGLAAWRFAEAGTPVGRGGTIDPLVAIGPALVLGLSAVVAVMAASPVTRIAAASTSGARGVLPVTALRLASRRPGRHALPITVVAFTVGIAVIASAYVGTVRTLGDAPEALRVGADVRVTTIPDTIDAHDVADTAVAAGAQTAALARGFSAQAATRIPVVAIESTEIGAVLLDAGGTLDPAELASALALPQGVGIPISGDAVDVTVTAPVPPPRELGGESFPQSATLASIRLTFVSDAGAVWETTFLNGTLTEAPAGDVAAFSSVDVDAEHHEHIALPTGSTWTLLAVSASPTGFTYSDGVLGVTATSGGAALDLASMVAAPGTAGAVTVDDGILTLAPTYSARGTALLTRAMAPDAPTSAPVVMTAELAASLSLDVGDTLDLAFDGPDFDASVTLAQTVPVLPGTPTGQGMLAGFDTLAFLSTVPVIANQVWVQADDPDAVAAAVSDAYSGPTVLVADPRQGSAAAATSWLFLLAAVGGAVLALVVLWLRRSRTPADARELALLAVLGLGRRRAGRVRVAEDLTALAMGIVGGLVAGVVTAWLIVPPLVRAAYGTVPDGYPVPLVWNLPLLAVTVGVFAALCGLVMASVRVPRALAAPLRGDE